MDRPERDDYDALTPWARDCYERGESTAQVIEALYGVDLPAEAYAFHQAYASGLDLRLTRLMHPWALLVADPADMPADLADTDEAWSEQQEAAAFAQWPRFLPLLQLLARDAIHGDHVIGYDLDLLRDGQTAILGYAGDAPPEGGKLTALGPSLLAVIHAWLSDHHRMLTEQLRSPRNRGFGALGDGDVDEVAAQLRAIEALQHGAASR